MSTFPKTYMVQGDTLTVNQELHDTLNELAGRFYQTLGYRHIQGHDYSSSSHPMENNMYIMALEACYMQQQSGELDG